jgi:DNA-binding MarR family transcriptional regulator
VSYAKDMSGPVEIDADFSGVLRLAVMRLARRLRNERVSTDLTLSQLAALATIERHGALTPGELAAQERVQPPSMTRIITTLAGAGLVDRTPHPTDGRQHLVHATSTGTALLAEDRRRRDAWLTQRLAELDPAEVEILRAATGILDRLASA